MATAQAPVEETVKELEKLILGLRNGTVRCISIHKMSTVERVGIYYGEAVYQKTETVDVSFTGAVK